MRGKYLKRLLAWGMAAIMTVGMTACGNETGARENDSQDIASSQTQDSEPQDNESQNEPVELTMVIVTDGTEYPNNDVVDQRVKEIVKRELNVELNIKRASMFDYNTSTNLWLTSGEPCDLFMSLTNWSNYSQYMIDLEEYKEYMPDALEAVGEYVDMSYVDGKLLGITSLKDLCFYDCYVMRKDYVEETGIDVSTLETYDDFETLIRAIKENHPEIYPVVNGGMNEGFLPALYTVEREDGTLFATNLFDNVLGIGLLHPTESTTVSCFYAEDTYRRISERAYDWSSQGLATVSDISSGSEQVMAGIAAGYSTFYKPGVAEQESLNCGMEMVVAFAPDESESVKQTNNTFSWSVNKNCANPERAVELLNLFYKNSEINNLLAWGIEGEDYEFVENSDNVIRYPEGVDSTNVKYYNGTKFALPNNYLQYVFEGQDPELWDKMKSFNDQAQTSLAFGFSFNAEPVMNEVAAVTNVVGQYHVGLTSGRMNPDEMLPQFLADLEQAGMQRIIDEVQAQLDSWLAEKEEP